MCFIISSFLSLHRFPLFYIILCSCLLFPFAYNVIFMHLCNIIYIHIYGYIHIYMYTFVGLDAPWTSFQSIDILSMLNYANYIYYINQMDAFQIWLFPCGQTIQCLLNVYSTTFLHWIIPLKYNLIYLWFVFHCRIDS